MELPLVSVYPAGGACFRSYRWISAKAEAVVDLCRGAAMCCVRTLSSLPAPSGPGWRLVPVGGVQHVLSTLFLPNPVSSFLVSAAVVSECTVFCTSKLAVSFICWFWPLGRPGSLDHCVLSEERDVTSLKAGLFISSKGERSYPSPCCSLQCVLNEQLSIFLRKMSRFHPAIWTRLCLVFTDCSVDPPPRF